MKPLQDRLKTPTSGRATGGRGRDRDRAQRHDRAGPHAARMTGRAE